MKFEHEAKTALATGQSEVSLDFHTWDWKFSTELPLAKMLPPGTRLRVVRKIVLQVLLTLNRHDLYRDMNAHSASGPRTSTLSTWVSFHQLRFGEEVPPFPLTTFKIYALGAMFKAGVYRSGSNYLGRAKEEHVSRWFLWTDELRLTVRKTTSSITRGIGPSRQSLPQDLSSVWNEGHHWLSDTVGVPVGGKYLIIAGGFFCTSPHFNRS